MPKLQGSHSENWVYADLHIHTPASRDYGGNKDRKEYFDILEKANSFQSGFGEEDDFPSNNIIAITDHNSISGYKNFLEIKKGIDNAIAHIKEIGQGSDILKELQKQDALFSNIHIIMGVEVKPDPGVHMLLLFREDVDPDSVVVFLEKAYGQKYDKINGDPNPGMVWTISQLLDEAQNSFGEKIVAIAPHVDSSSGLFESLKSLPQPRIAAFKHDLLKAVSYNNPDTRSKIEATLKNKEYNRSHPIAFIQDSDYHGHPGTNIGNQHVRIKINSAKPSFTSVVEAFKTQENIKCSVDYSKERYSEAVDGYAVVKFRAPSENSLTIDPSEFDVMSLAVCSFLNTSGGIIEISGSITNLENCDKIISESIDKISTTLDTHIDPPCPSISSQVIQFSQSRNTLLLRFKRSKRLHVSNGAILVWDVVGHKPRQATPVEIECIVAENLSQSYGERSKERLTSLAFEVKKLGKTQTAYPLITRIRPYLARGFLDNFKSTRYESMETNASIEHAANESMLGKSDGNTFILPGEFTPPRLTGSYLRIFPQCFQISDSDFLKTLPSTEGNSIIVLPGGGAYLLIEGKRFFTNSTCCNLIPAKTCCPHAQIAWIKSSFFIWYCLLMLNSSDLLMHVIRERKDIPILEEKILSTIQPHLKAIIVDMVNEEKVFLGKFEKETNNGVDDSKISELINSFNSTMDKFCLEIDINIFKAINMKYKDAVTIYSDLQGLDVYTHNALDNHAFMNRLKSL